MVDSDDLYGPMEVDDDLSTALDTESLADKDMVPPSFDNNPGSSADTLPVEIFEHWRFLRVECSATLHSGQKESKIWDHGTELPSARLDEYWKYPMVIGHSFYTCNVRRMRESLQQCKEASQSGEKYPSQ
jgi:hypothetical protein